MIRQPSTTMNGDFPLLHIFQIGINKPKWSISGMIVGNKTLPTIHIHEIFKLLNICYIRENI